MKLQVKDTSTRHGTGQTVRTKFAGIAQIARDEKDAKFYSLAHLMNKNTLKEAFKRLRNTAAPGIDQETKAMYKENLEGNIGDLVTRLKSNSYHPTPVKRVYIPKENKNKKRPIGILVLEDKIVQTALVMILENIYEQDFLDLSFGFRPKRNCHDALKKVSKNIGTGKVSYVVDADIKGFFDNVNHEWIMKFLSHRIADATILRQGS